MPLRKIGRSPDGPRPPLRHHGRASQRPVDERRTAGGYEPKELVRRVFDVINTEDLDRADEVIHPEYTEISPFGEGLRGPDGFRQLIGMFRSAFPDLHVTVEDVIVEGDVAAWRATATGTHQGELMGIPPTGRRVTFTTIDFGRMKDGLAYEHRPSTDLLGLLHQLGVIPEMAPARA
jgi:predicted ester cyclase